MSSNRRNLNKSKKSIHHKVSQRNLPKVIKRPGGSSTFHVQTSKPSTLTAYLPADTSKAIGELSEEQKAQYRRRVEIAKDTAAYVASLNIRSCNKRDVSKKEQDELVSSYMAFSSELTQWGILNGTSFEIKPRQVALIVGQELVYHMKSAELAKTKKIGNCGELADVGLCYIMESNPTETVCVLSISNKFGHRLLCLGLNPEIHLGMRAGKVIVNEAMFSDPSVILIDLWAGYYLSAHAVLSYLKSGRLDKLLDISLGHKADESIIDLKTLSNIMQCPYIFGPGDTSILSICQRYGMMPSDYKPSSFKPYPSAQTLFGSVAAAQSSFLLPQQLLMDDEPRTSTSEIFGAFS